MLPKRLSFVIRNHYINFSKNVLENLLLTEVERTHKNNKKRDKSLGVLSRRFVAMFLIHPVGF